MPQLEDRVHTVMALYGYNNGGAILTLVLPLGFFIVVMIALYFVFSRPHTVPGHRPVTGAKPVAPAGEAAAPLAAAAGFPTAASAGGTEPLADRGTPPVPSALSGQAADETRTATGDTASDESAADDPAASSSAANEPAPDEPAADGPTATENPEENE